MSLVVWVSVLIKSGVDPDGRDDSLSSPISFLAARSWTVLDLKKECIEKLAFLNRCEPHHLETYHGFFDEGELFKLPDDQVLSVHDIETRQISKIDPIILACDGDMI